MGRTKRHSDEYRAAASARAAADVDAARNLVYAPIPERRPAPTLYPSWRQGGARECLRPTCARIRDIGDRSGYCPIHSLVHRWPDPTIPEVQAYLDELVAAGARIEDIARAAGVAASTVNRLRAAAPTARVGTFVRWSIIGLDPAEAVRTVPRWRVSRRMRALVAAGWGIGELVDLTGVNEATVRVWLAEPSAGRVTMEKARPLLDAWPELEASPVRPLNRHLSRWMVARKWQVPAAWDDIDAPDCDPTPQIVIPKGERLPSLRVLRKVAEHHGIGYGSEFTGSTPNWFGGVIAAPRRAAVVSTVYDLAVSAARAEFDRLAARRQVERRAVNGVGVRDGAALETASA